MKKLRLVLISLLVIVLAACNANQTSTEGSTEGATDTTTAPTVTESTDATTTTAIEEPLENLLFFNDEILEVDVAAQSLSLKGEEGLSFVSSSTTRYVDATEQELDPAVFWGSVVEGQSIMLEGVQEDGSSIVIVETVIVP